MTTINNGISFYADTAQAESGFQRMSRLQDRLLADSRVFAREYPANMDKGLNAFTRLGDIMRQTYSDAGEMKYFTRQIVNQLNSIVMSGVAVSMTGVSFLNMGRAVTNYFKEAVNQATDFEKTMKQIEFLGDFSKDIAKRKAEVQDLQNEIMKVATSHPTSNKGMAEGMLEAMRAGYTQKQAKDVMLPVADLAFLSMDKLKEDESVKFLNAYLKTMNKDTEYARTAVDKISKTADEFTTDVEGIWKAFQSTRAAFDNLGMENMIGPDSSFLTLIGAVSTQFKDRAAGEMINSFARGMLQAAGAGKTKPDTERGGLWNSLGIDLNKETDMLDTLMKINEKSEAIWGKDRTLWKKNLITLFGVEGLPVLQMFDKLKAAGVDVKNIRDNIEGSAGYSKQFMDFMMNTSYGTQKIMEGTKETFDTLMGIAVLGPVNKVLKLLSDGLEAVTTVAQKHPELAKFVATLVLVGGALTTVLGGTLLVVGGMMAMYGSIASAVVSFAHMNVSLDTMRKGMNSLGSVWDGLVGGPMKRFMFSALRMMGIAGLLYFAWQHNFMGMKDFTDRLNTSITKAQELSTKFVATLNGVQYATEMENLRKNDPLTAWFTDKFAKAKAFAVLLKAIWNDDRVDAKEVGGEKEFRRYMSLWKEMGLLPVIDTILDWKHNFKAMWEGFKTGAKQAGEIILPILKGIGAIATWLYSKFLVFGKMFGFINADNDKLKGGFEGIGQVIGWVAGMLLGGWMVMKAWRLTLGPIITLIRKLGKGSYDTYDFFRKMSKTKVFDTMKKGFESVTKSLTKYLVKLAMLDKIFPKKFSSSGAVLDNGKVKGQKVVTKGRQFVTRTFSQNGETAGGVRTRRKPSGPAAEVDLKGGRKGTITYANTGNKTLKNLKTNRDFEKTVQQQTKDRNMVLDIFGEQSRRHKNAEEMQRKTRHEKLVKEHKNRTRTIHPQELVDGEVRTKQGKGAWGKFKDIMLGREYDIDTTSGGRKRVKYTNKKGNVAERSVKIDNPIKKREGTKFSNFFSNIGERHRNAWSKTFGKKGPGIVANTVGMGSIKVGGGVGKTVTKGLTTMGPSVGKSLGTGLFKSLTSVFRMGAPLIGRVLKVGLLGALKIGLRAIPIVGELLMAWDLITLVWSNWDAIEAGFKKAWDWIKDYLSDATWMPGWLKQLLGLQEITNPLLKVLHGPELTPEQKERYDIDKNGYWKSFGNFVADDAKSVYNTMTDPKTWKTFGQGAKEAPGRAWEMINPFDGKTGLEPRGHRTGLDFVPKDNYPAMLHRGEMVLDNQEATTLRGAMGNGSVQDALQSRMKPAPAAQSAAATASTSTAAVAETNISFAPGAVVIQMQSGSQAEIEKAAEALFQKFKRKVELENMRNYRASRG